MVSAFSTELDANVSSRVITQQMATGHCNGEGKGIVQFFF